MKKNGSDPSPPTGSAPASGFILNNSPDLPVHYLHTTPSPVFGITGLMLALALLSLGISQIRQTNQQAFLTIAATGTATDGVPVLTITATTWAINDQPIAETDVPFRLSALSAQNQAIVIEHAPNLSAEHLTKALETVNQAGFAQVGVRLTGEGRKTSP